MRTGIDVHPTTAVIYADDFDKAWEHGGWTKLVLGLSWSKLDHTFREVPVDTPGRRACLVDRAIPDEASQQ